MAVFTEIIPAMGNQITADNDQNPGMAWMCRWTIFEILYETWESVGQINLSDFSDIIES